MPVLVVANPKGGVGKSTLATHAAGYWASQGHAVMLGDVDPQQSSRLWLSLRPESLASIQSWEVQDALVVRPPRGTSHVVLDTPAGVSELRLRELLRLADKVLVPLQASIFDIYATRAFLDQLQTLQRGRSKPEIGLVGMRVDERTRAARQLRQFTDSLKLPVVAMLRPTQNYVHLAAHGLTLFDLPPGRVQRDLEQWEELRRWLDR